ncbi:hypothetical protein ABZ477_16050 [Microbacterium sp. NPDC019599]
MSPLVVRLLGPGQVASAALAIVDVKDHREMEARIDAVEAEMRRALDVNF